MTIWSEPTAAFGNRCANDCYTAGDSEGRRPGTIDRDFPGNTHLYSQLFIGNRAGSIGETSALHCIGALFLFTEAILRRISLYHSRFAGMIAWIFGAQGTLFAGDPLLHLLSAT
jgi:Na+-transporting NADH:ubiquinone oxidoreductase subunit NqrB